MKKLMKKKVNVFGKSIPVFVIAIFAMVLVSAALVPFLSNTILGDVTVSSPIALVITDASDGDKGFADVTFTNGPESYSVSLHGSESFWIETTLNNHVDGLLGYIGENKIVGFDGVGMTLTYEDDFTLTPFPILGCDGGDGNWYFYIGDPNDALPAIEIISTTTVTTALNLEPRTYNAVTKVVPEADIKCGPFKLS